MILKEKDVMQIRIIILYIKRFIMSIVKVS